MLLTGVVKTALALALVGVVGFDGLSVGITALHTADDASAAASAAASAYSSVHSVAQAYQAAQAALATAEAIPPASFAVDGAGDVSLEVRRTSPTLLLGRIHPLARYAVVVESGHASAPVS